jgi:hypothetical protein
MSLGKLDPILQRDGFIIYISGAKEKGKTDFALLLAEYCHLKGYRTKITTNIETQSYMIEKQICNLPDLRDWLEESKRKLFILDEAGLSIPKLRFMSSMNIEVMKILQLIRHYDAGFIGIAPSTKNIDSTFMDTDILDAHIKKLAKPIAIVKDYLQNESYFIEDIPRTSINFNTKRIAEFVMDKKPILSDMPLCCQAAAIYASTGKYKNVEMALNKHPEQVKRLIREHCRHSLLTTHTPQVGLPNREELVEAQT